MPKLTQVIAEDELVALLKKKDKRALEYLYDNYSAAVYGVIFRIVNTKELADEVLQDCFLKVWERIGTYDAQKGRLFTWMINIARNLAIDKLRSSDVKKSRSTQDVDLLRSVNDESYSEKNNPEHIGVKEMLDNLSPEQKFVLDLMYFQGYSQSEISDEYNIPLGTVKTRVRSAIGKLREWF